MAVIGKIRQKSSLLLIIIGIALLAFILGDYINSRRNVVSSEDTSIAVIGGENIEYKNFQRAVEEQLALLAQNNANQALSENKKLEEARNQAWNKILNINILQNEYQNLGIHVTSEELLDNMIGDQPNQEILRAFTDPNTNKFDKQKVLDYIKNIDALEEKSKKLWYNFENILEESIYRQKYNTLVEKSFFITNEEVESQFKEKNTVYNISFLLKNYNTVETSDILISDEEINNYYNNNKYLFKKEKGYRNVNYLKFDYNPSQADYDKTLKDINNVYAELEKSENDTDFVQYNYESKEDGIFIYNQAELPLILDATDFFLPKGSMIGPKKDKESFIVYKITNKNISPDSVKVRHILIASASDSLSKIRADSILNVINQQGASFEELAQKFSLDKQTKDKGGEIGWIKEGNMIKEINDFCFNQEVETLALIKTAYGYHITEITAKSKKSKKIYLTRVSRKIAPSTETIDSIFSLAVSFYTNNESIEKFNKSFSANPLGTKQTVRIKEGERNIAGLESPSEFIRWIFNQTEPKVSEPIQINNTVVVAMLDDLGNDEYSKLDEVKEDIRSKLINKKKAEKVKKELGNLDITTFANNQNAQLTDAQVNFSTASIANFGVENEVVGKLVNLQKPTNGKHLVIAGNSGIYVVDVKSITPVDESQPKTIFKSIIKQQNRFKTFGLFNELIKAYDVKDYRYKFL